MGHKRHLEDSIKGARSKQCQSELSGGGAQRLFFLEQRRTDTFFFKKKNISLT